MEDQSSSPELPTPTIPLRASQAPQPTSPEKPTDEDPHQGFWFRISSAVSLLQPGWQQL